MADYDFSSATSTKSVNLGTSLDAIEALKNSIAQLEKIGEIESFNGPTLYIEGKGDPGMFALNVYNSSRHKKAAELSERERFIVALVLRCSAKLDRVAGGYCFTMKYPFVIVDHPSGQGFYVYERRNAPAGVWPKTVDFRP